MHRLTAILLIATGLLLSTAAQGRDANRPAAIVRTQTAITIDGDLADWESIEAQHAIHTPEGDPAATFKLAYDAEYLYAAFYVIDDSPMRNSSATLQELIKGGDAIGICLGAGGVNQRIITAQVDGRPVIMAYRPTWPQKRPHTFSSPVSDLPMDYVGPIDGARAAFGRREGGYTAELALPWRGLGIRGDFTGTIPFDVQIIFSDPAGTTNVESAWWHATGGGAFTTEDLPTEAALYPDTWGQARLHERDPGPRIIRTDTAAEVGTPITFELPRDARVSMLIVDIDGWIVRELVRAERMHKGTHTVYWDGRDRYDEPLPPGVYTWRLAYFDGMGTKFHGSVGNSARPPFRTVDGKGSKGGQHGGPSVLGVDKGGVYIMGGGEEGHPAMRKIDLDGYTLWKRSMGGFGRGIAVAVDDDYVYIVQASRNDMHLTRLNPNSGAEVALPGNARVRIGDNRLRVAGLAIAGDKAYFSVPSENRIGVVNLADGTLGRDIAIEMPQGVARLDVRRLLVCSGTEIKEVNLATGAARTAITGLSAPRAIATDAQGRIYVSDLGDSQQIKIFNANRLTRTIGKAGGRAATVLEYDPNELQNVVGLGVDAEGHVWAVEQSPIRRVARFSATGEHKLDLYGPVAYNVFGPDLDDFSRVYYQTSQGSPVFARTRLDYDAYSADPVRGGTDAWQIEAVFRLTQEADTEAGEVDLMTSPMSPGYGHVVAFTATNGHRYLWRFAKSNRASNPAGAAIWRWTTNGWVPAAFVSNRSNAKSWSDTNGDGRVQPEELYDAPPTNHFAWLDRDLVLYGWHGTVAPSRFDERGVPFYDGGEYKTYLDEGQPSIPGGWVFNSMPDEEGAVYYVGNIGPHRHAAGSWDRACENPIIKVKDGRINWVIGQHDALVRHEADMNTVTGVAGIVDDILIAHIVEPARYIAFTTDGFTLGNVIVDETGRQPRVGPNAIYIESFTGLFLRDPESGKRLLFAVSSGDDRILEVTGPGDLTRVEGEIILPSSFPREPAPVGQAVIPYETWWGSNARGYSIDANDWQWLPRSAGLSIYEDNAIVGDVRMRRDAGALHILANTIAPYPRQPDFTPQAPSDLWGNWTGVELLIGPARPVNGRRPMPGDTRIFLAVHDGKGVALAHRSDTPGWKAIPGAQVAVRRRWHGYGWRLEAEIPFEALPEVTRERLQVFRRGVQIQTHQEERLDFAGPVRLNAALHIYDGTKVRRVPWVDDGTRLDQPGQMQPDRWGYANAMVELSWQESFDAEEFSIYRASVEQPHAVARVAEKVWGTSHIDTPEPGDYLYWLAPVTHEGEGQPFGPVASQESAAGFPSVKEVAAYQFDEIGDIVIRKPHNVGLANIAVQAQAVSASSPPGIRTSATKNGHENWIVSVMAPANSQIGSVYTIRLRATGADGNVSESSFDAVVGVDMMAGLPLGSMAPGKEGATGWIRSPQTNAATGSPIHVVTVTNTDGIPAPSIEMRAWNVNNLITYRLNSKPTQSYWEASGHIRVITRAGGTTIGITMLDANDSSIANLEFGRGRVGAETTEYISLQGEYVATAADYRISGTWQPFTIRAENGIIRMTYGSGNRSYTIEKEALRGSTWNEPGALRVYLGGQSSGRHANVDNLFFISK